MLQMQPAWFPRVGELFCKPAIHPTVSSKTHQTHCLSLSFFFLRHLWRLPYLSLFTLCISLKALGNRAKENTCNTKVQTETFKYSCKSLPCPHEDVIELCKCYCGLDEEIVFWWSTCSPSRTRFINLPAAEKSIPIHQQELICIQYGRLFICEIFLNEPANQHQTVVLWWQAMLKLNASGRHTNPFSS